MEAAKILLSRKDYQGSSVLCHEILALLPDNLEARNLLGQVKDAQTPRWVRFLKDMRTYLPTLMKATVMTLLLVLITMLLSPVGGLFIALGRISRMKVLSGLFWCYIWIFRGRRCCSSSSSSTTGCRPWESPWNPFPRLSWASV